MRYLVLLLLLLAAVPAFSECCESCILAGNECDDGQLCRPSDFYCGKGPCNVFGCNCDGGCKKCDSPRSCCIKDCKAVYSDSYDRCSHGCWDAVAECSAHCAEIAAREREKCESRCPAALTSASLRPSPSTESSSRLAFGRLSRLDRDRSGDLSPMEVGPTFKSLDADKSGTVTLNEVDPDAGAVTILGEDPFYITRVYQKAGIPLP